MFKTCVWTATILVVLVTASGWAALNGDIEAVVKDASGAVVPSARATITSVETGAQRALISNERGYFIAALLPIGYYNVKVELAGFRTYEQQVLVKSAERVSLNIKLEVGGVSEAVSVTEPTIQLINTTDAQLSNSIEEKRVKELPLSTRDPLVLATLSPGVVPVTDANPFLNTGSFNANGGRGRSNNITIDNVVSTDVFTTGSAGFGTLSLDAIQEFKLITNNFNAEFGRNSSAQVQIITKGGTNNFHGTVYEFLKNDALNARDYFDTTGKASIVRRNEFGATAGGPILKDKMFFFGTYEGLQSRGAGGTRSARVPTAAQLAAVTDPTSKAILAAANLPAATSIDSSGTGRVAQVAPNGKEENAWSARIDRNFGGGRDVLTGRYAIQKSTQNSESNTFVGTDLAGFGASTQNKPQNLSLGWTRLISSRMVNEARFAFGRFKPSFFPQFTGTLPRINITGLNLFGESDIVPQGRVQNTFQYSDSFTYNVGRHVWKTGMDVHRIQANSYQDSNVRSTLMFASWNDFAAGQLFSYTQSFGSSVRGNRVTNVFAYGQDDFKIRPDLTLNLGVRVEIAGGVREVNNILSNLDFKNPAPIGAAGAGPLGSFVLGGTSFSRNVNPEPRLGFSWNPGRGRFVLRGGYGITHDFIFLNPITNLRFTAPFIQRPALTGAASFADPNSLANIFAGAAPVQINARAAVGSFSSTQTNFGNLISAIDRDLDNPQVQQWNLTLEHQVTDTLAIKAGYVGTVGHHLLRTRQVNMIPPGTVRPAANEADEFARLTEFQSVFTRSNAATTGTSNRIDPRFNQVTLVEGSVNSNYHAFEAQLLKRLSSGYQFQLAYTWSKSIDDASDVLNVVVNDYPTAQNPFNLRDNRGVSQFDIPHRLVINHNYEPQFFKNVGGVAGKILRGWQFNGIFEVQSGFPTNIFAGPRYGIGDTALTGNTISPNNIVRPNVVGDLSKLVFAPAGSPLAATIPSPAARGVNAAGTPSPNTNTSGYPLVQPLLGTFGNLGRNVLRLNKFEKFDWVVVKNTNVTEDLIVQFRSEFYNVFNQHSFARFVNDLSSPNFGTYSGTDTNPRQIQFALKLVW